jgi:hypothetical protein
VCVKLRRAGLQDRGRQRTMQLIEIVTQSGPRQGVPAIAQRQGQYLIA